LRSSQDFRGLEFGNPYYFENTSSGFEGFLAWTQQLTQKHGMEKTIRTEIEYSYTHMDFTVTDQDFDSLVQKLEELGVNILPVRKRDERDKSSVYLPTLMDTN
jgi:hypothetical protein